MDKVKVAVIGCGGISRAHFNGHAVCEGSEVLYAVDIDEAKAKEKAEVMGCQWHTDYLAIIDEVDAVDICTAPHLHAEMTVEAARRGKHVLTEKIMARTLPEARWMIEEVDKAGVIFMVAFVLRYRPEFEMMNQYSNPEYKKLIEDMKVELKKTRVELNETDEKYPHIQKIIDANWE